MQKKGDTRHGKKVDACHGDPCIFKGHAFFNVRVHDLKHTCGRRLRAAGVPLETRRVLLGHKNSDITTHYSAPEIAELIEAAERVCGKDSRKTPELTILRVRESAVSN